MKMKFAGTLLLLGALLSPVITYAEEKSTDTAGQYLDDTAITAKVKTVFAKDEWVKGREISVRTERGTVHLTGTVNSKDEFERATKLVTQVESVKAVHNNLKIMPR
ncbi:BON domain-containing protein [Neisseriaceae bacterium TC5R-5]|nr:BON domain-containing protein [Neisseriaceae bacterium TC5R-5]